MLQDLDLKYVNGVLATGKNFSAPTVSATTLAATGASSVAHLASSGNVLGAYQPNNHGVVGWSYDPVAAASATLITNGQVNLTKILIPVSVAVTTIYWSVTTAGATPTAGQNEVGLYSSAGTKLASVNVDSSVSSTGLKTGTISSQSLTAGSFVWVGWVFNATTAPTLARAMGGASAAGTINLGLAASAFRFAVNGTGQTVLPSSVTTGSNLQGTSWWAAIG